MQEEKHFHSVLEETLQISKPWMSGKFVYPFWSCGRIGGRGEKTNKQTKKKTTQEVIFFTYIKQFDISFTNNWILMNESALYFAPLERDGHCIIKAADGIWPSLYYKKTVSSWAALIGSKSYLSRGMPRWWEGQGYKCSWFLFFKTDDVKS